VAWLNAITEQGLADGRTSARAYADAFCSWVGCVEAMEGVLQSFTRDA